MCRTSLDSCFLCAPCKPPLHSLRSPVAAGNEDAVEVYVNFTGFMWELGSEMNALLIFAEVRILYHACTLANCNVFCGGAEEV